MEPAHDSKERKPNSHEYKLAHGQIFKQHVGTHGKCGDENSSFAATCLLYEMSSSTNHHVKNAEKKSVWHQISAPATRLQEKPGLPKNGMPKDCPNEGESTFCVPSYESSSQRCTQLKHAHKELQTVSSNMGGT